MRDQRNIEVAQQDHTFTAMSSIPAFISELIRAANEIEKLTAHEISRPLDRSVDTIREMREQTPRVDRRRARDVLIDLQVASSRARDLSPEDARDTLLDAADMIRALRIMQGDQE
ncbi:hypothetical protein ABIE33_003602 [Ensifer sp. 4252]